MLNAALLAALLLAVAGCATAPAVRAFPSIGFSHLQPIALNVAEIIVDDRRTAPDTAALVDPRLDQAPGAVAEAWAVQRLRAAGSTGIARLVVEDAHLYEERLPRTRGLQGLLTNEQTERYTLRYLIRLEVSRVGETGSAEAFVERQQTVSESATLAEREAVWFSMIADGSTDLDTALAAEIGRSLSAFTL